MFYTWLFNLDEVKTKTSQEWTRDVEMTIALNYLEHCVSCPEVLATAQGLAAMTEMRRVVSNALFDIHQK